jgi:hypothetical protein
VYDENLAHFCFFFLDSYCYGRWIWEFDPELKKLAFEIARLNNIVLDDFLSMDPTEMQVRGRDTLDKAWGNVHFPPKSSEESRVLETKFLERKVCWKLFTVPFPKPQAQWKFVILDIDRKKHIVTSKDAWHADIVKEVKREYAPYHGEDFTKMEVLGGGKMCVIDGKIHLWSYSGDYGRFDAHLVARLTSQSKAKFPELRDHDVLVCGHTFIDKEGMFEYDWTMGY